MKLIEMLIQNTGWFDPRDPHKTVFPLHRVQTRLLEIETSSWVRYLHELFEPA